MNFIESAQILVPTLLGIPVTVFGGEGESLQAFEERYCFEPTIQKWFTRQGLIDFFENSQSNQIYELTDALEIKITVFKIEEEWIILGPFVIRTWNEWDMKILLAETGLTTTHMVSYKLYRCNLAVVYSSDVLRTATIMIENTVGNTPTYEIKEISAIKKHYHVRELEPLEDVEVVNQRYNLENRFMDALYKGKTKIAIELLHELGNSSMGLSYYTPDIRDRIAGAAIIRTLTRKAAEKAGLTPVVIDAVSQQYAQQIHLAVRTDNVHRLLEKYVAEICLLVRQEQKRVYSQYIKATIQYIDVHMSDALSTTILASVVGITPIYLSRLFVKETGMTVNQYIANVRCLKAAELLQDSDLSIQEISAFVGCLDNNYFSKIFKRHMGFSPTDYRKKQYHNK